MPKDKPTNPEAEDLRKLPKPIQLNLPRSHPKPARRLHEPEKQPTRQERVNPKSPTGGASKKSGNPSDKRYFSSAQRAYGQRRPRPPKEPKPKRRWWYHTQTGPMLGQGGRLYTPPQPKQPFFPPHIWRIVRLWPLGVIAVAIGIMAMINVFSYNAWAVYLDGQLLGHMPINREIEPESIHDVAVRHRRDILGADEVLVNEAVEVRTVRAGRRELYTSQDMIRLISQNFTYQVMASAIYLEGERVATLRNQAEALHVQVEIMRRFENDGYTIRSLSAFEEDWQIIQTAIDINNMDEDMDNPNEVIQFLERPIQDLHRHVIRSGDTQGGLAVEFNTTVDRIGYHNDISSDAILVVGNILLIEVTRPRLTVRTVDEVEFIELIPRDVETIENPNMLATAYEIINEGRDGEIQIVQRITRLNGVQVGAPEVISQRELSAPVTQVVEVGTLDTVIETR
ncbi:MAG: G5 domain-containing protein [Defluviitaleaceae bacterium]|nr:G5 domain-containing protein [Defluviitaleaceae bacterium]